MNPLLSAAVGAFLRHGLTWAAGYIVAWGIWTAEEATGYVAGAVIFLLAYGWSYFQKMMAEKKVEVALEMPPGTSMKALDVAVANK